MTSATDGSTALDGTPAQVVASTGPLAMNHRLRGAGLVLVVLLALGATMAVRQSAAVPAVAVVADAQAAHAQGTCGSLGPGTGLQGNKGWVVSMLPGLHEFRARNGGAAYVTVAKQTRIDADAGRPYYIVVEGATKDTVLEWKTPKGDWSTIPTTFLYPPQGALPVR